MRRLLEAQHGLVTRGQAVEAGLSGRRVDLMVKRGLWVRLRPRVYAVAGAPPTWEQAVLAALLAAGGGAVASHRTAGALWRFKGIALEVIELTTGLDRRVRLDGVVAHRSGALFDSDVTRQRGIAVTTRARTIVDLSGAMSASELGPVLDDALRGGLRLRDVRRCLGRLERSPGRRPSVVHELLAARMPGYDPGDSDLETRVLRALVAARLPVPRQRYGLVVDRKKCRIDLAYPDERVAIELDGWDVHRTRTAFDNDRARDNALLLDGWCPLRFTSRSTDTDIVASVRAARARFGQPATAGVAS